MKTALNVRIVQEWPAIRFRRRTRDKVTLRQARRLVGKLNAESLHRGWGTWLRIDLRRGWLVVEYYPPECN